MNLLIIGGSGLLGGRIYQYFNQKKNNVKILVRKKNKKLNKFKKKDIIKINFKKYDELFRACKEVDVIIHAAGMNSKEALSNTIESNYIKESFNKKLIQVAKNTSVKKIIFISTIHVYSKFLNQTYFESSKTNNKHPYALASLRGEKALLKNSNQNTEILILRLSNCFGRPIDAGVNCWTLFINDLCKQSVINKKMIIYQNPKIKRDFLEISNLVNILDYFINKKNKLKHKIINIGSGKSYTLYEMAKIISKRVNVNLGFSPSIILKKTKINQKVNSNFTLNIDKLKRLKIEKISNTFNEIDKIIMFCKKNYASKLK